MGCKEGKYMSAAAVLTEAPGMGSTSVESTSRQARIEYIIEYLGKNQRYTPQAGFASRLMNLSRSGVDALYRSITVVQEAPDSHKKKVAENNLTDRLKRSGLPITLPRPYDFKGADKPANVRLI